MAYIDDVGIEIIDKKLRFKDNNKNREVNVSISVRLDDTVTDVSAYVTPNYNRLTGKIKWGHSFTIPNNPIGQDICNRINAIVFRVDSTSPLADMGTGCVGYRLPAPVGTGPIECLKWDFRDIMRFFKQPVVMRNIRGVATPCQDPAPIHVEYDATGATVTIDLVGQTFTPGQVVELDPVTQTGSFLEYAATDYYDSSGTFSSTITVPSDAQVAFVGTANYCTHATKCWNGDGQITLTKGGADSAMTLLQENVVTDVYNGELFYIVSPDTGSNKSLKWNWNGTQTMETHHVGVPIVLEGHGHLQPAIVIHPRFRQTRGNRRTVGNPYADGENG